MIKSNRSKELKYPIKTRSNSGRIWQSFSASKGNVATWEKGLSLPNKERLSMISKYGDINVTQLLYNSNDDNSELEEKFLMIC